MENKRKLSQISSILFAFAFLFIMGCSSGGTTITESEISRSSHTLHGKCDHRAHAEPKERQCREWIGDGFETFDLEVSCDAIPGSYAEGFCPLGGLIGVCVLNENQPYTTRFYYYNDQWDENTAIESCDNKDLTEITGNTPSKWYPALEFIQEE